MRPRVLKFGGTSLGSPERVRGAVAILRAAAEEGPVVAVASAFAGVTDQLFALADRARRRDGAARASLAELVERHRAMLLALAPGDRAASAAVEEELDALAETLEGVALLRDLPDATRDRVASAGERLAVAVLAAALRDAGLPAAAVDAAELLVTDSACGEAEIDLAASGERIRSRLVPRLGRELAVVPGFYGGGLDGAVRLLGRGASDLTATVLGAGLGASRVEIWTDVDGVLSADPRLVPEARTLPWLTPEMAGELAHFGARVLHPRAVRPAAAAGVPIVVANSLRPAAPRTAIGAGVPVDGVRALASLAGIGRLRVAPAAHGGPGDAARIAAALAGARLRVLVWQQAASRGTVTLALPASDVGAARVALTAAGLAVEAREGLGLLAVLGAGTAASARRTLGELGAAPLLWGEVEGEVAVALVEEDRLGVVARRLHAEVVAAPRARRAAA